MSVGASIDHSHVRLRIGVIDTYWFRSRVTTLPDLRRNALSQGVAEREKIIIRSPFQELQNVFTQQGNGSNHRLDGAQTLSGYP